MPKMWVHKRRRCDYGSGRIEPCENIGWGNYRCSACGDTWWLCGDTWWIEEGETSVTQWEIKDVDEIWSRRDDETVVLTSALDDLGRPAAPVWRPATQAEQDTMAKKLATISRGR